MSDTSLIASSVRAPVSPGPASEDDPVRSDTIAAAARVKFAAPDALEPPADDAGGWRGLPVDHYADPQTREYPIHTPQAAAASATSYCYLRGPDDHPVAERIKAACAAWGFPELWDRLRQHVADEIAAEKPPERYCWPEQKRYPVHTPDLVAKAAAYFVDWEAEMEPEECRIFARNLLDAADAVGGLPPGCRHRLEKAAGLGRPADSESAFGPRKAAARASGRWDLLRALTQAQQAVERGADGYAVANLLKQADTVCGWRFPDPTEALTGLTPTAAKEAARGLVVAASGRVYRRDDLARVPAELLAPWGIAAAATLAKRAQLLRSDTSGSIEAVVASAGVTPLGSALPEADGIDWNAWAEADEPPSRRN